jgi:hypothetical protein
MPGDSSNRRRFPAHDSQFPTPTSVRKLGGRTRFSKKFRKIGEIQKKSVRAETTDEQQKSEIPKFSRF